MKDISFLKSTKIAHRGIYDNKRIYENTLSAYLRAVKKGYIIHIDVRILKDGEIVCFHDDSLERLLHVESDIDKMTYEELCYIAKYQIPTLKETLELINGSVPIIVELRNKIKKNQFEEKIVSILDDYKGLFAIQSFHLSILKWFYKNRKNYITGYLICKKNCGKDYFFKKYDFLNVNILLFNDKRVKRMRASKLVIGYKVLNKAEYNRVNTLYDNLEFDNILEIDTDE